MHLSASISFSPCRMEKVLVGTVEEAVQLGADGVSIHVNIGCDEDRSMLQDAGKVSRACMEWGMPLLMMVYP
ncbi:2-amino-4,5-dihydroxy-6-one-heptanoic acid-7-phosphate synthase [compost metagenome]